MADKITKVQDVGFFGTLKESIKRVFGGVGLIFIAPLMLFWNECRSVQTAKSLEEGQGAAISVQSVEVDPKLEGQLVHTNGESDTTATLTDQSFQIKAKGLKMRRTVEMYQWVEHEETRTENDKKITTYTYSKEWEDEVINASRFEEPDGHGNPGSMPYEAQTWTVESATLGAFALSSEVIDKLSNYDKIAVTDEQAAVVGAKAHDGRVYLGPTPSTPTVGDVRIGFEVVPVGPTSVVGRQVGNTFEPYQTQAGDRLLLVKPSIMSKDEMFEAAKAENRMMTWVLRFVGFFMIFGGFSMVLGPLKVLGDRIPVVGGVISGGTTLISFFLAVIFAFFTISFAWIAARPLLGVALLLVGLGGVAGVVMLIIKAKKSGGDAPSEPEPA